ncbi:unnamed protein product [Alopecurus aequalis]
MSRSASVPLALLRSVSTDKVDYYALGHPSQPPPWRPLPCISKRAVGFDSSSIGAADNVLDALHLDAHLADAPALSYLKIRLGAGTGRIGPRPSILAVDDNLILLESSIPSPARLVTYLVYDAAAQSITMIPSHPWSQHQQRDPLSPAWQHRPTALVRSILIARAPGDDDPGSYALVIIGERTVFFGEDHRKYEAQDVLYVWRSCSPRWDLVTVTAGFPAEFKGGNVAHAYGAVVAFSCGGRAFWANLVRGVMHCSRDALLLSASNGGAGLEFGFIPLPVEIPRQPPRHGLVARELHANVYRTMGRVGDSAIKFVAIDGFFEMLDFLDCTLTVWTLSPDQDDDVATSWTESFQLSMGSLAEQDEFRNAGLPTDMVPMYPSLSAEEDDVIYFMLGEYAPCCYRHKAGSKDNCDGYVAVVDKATYLLRVDMRRGVLLGSARIPSQLPGDLTLSDLSRYLSGASGAPAWC